MSLMNSNNDGLTIAYLLQKLKDELKTALSSAVETINTALDGKVPITRKVNGHALSSDVTVTKSDVGLGNVENKSSATIRGEITSTNVTDALGYTPVNKAGDTMTGDLKIQKASNVWLNMQHTSADIATTPSSNMNWTLHFIDQNSNAAGYIQEMLNTDGSSRLHLVTGREINGTSYSNYVTLRVKSDGSKAVDLSDKAAWREALGISDKVLYLTNIACSAQTGDFVSLSNSAITADHVVAECVFANPSYITTAVTWTTSSGSLKINGTCSAATTCNVVLVEKDN